MKSDKSLLYPKRNKKLRHGFKTPIWRMRGTWWTRRVQRIWRIRRIRRIFKSFRSFIYSATKGVISSSKLTSELYLAEGLTTNQ